MAGPDFGVGYLDRCAWRDLPTPTLVAPNTFMAERIRRDIGRLLRDRGVTVEIVQGAAA